MKVDNGNSNACWVIRDPTCMVGLGEEERRDNSTPEIITHDNIIIHICIRAQVLPVYADGIEV